MPIRTWTRIALLLGTLTAWRSPAYQAPLQSVTAIVVTNGFSFDLDFTVFDPDLQLTRLGRQRYSGTASDFWRLRDLTIIDGVAVWRVDRNGPSVPLDTEVGCALYDPALEVWKLGTWRHDASLLQQWTVTNLVASGTLVAWVAEMGGTGSFRDTEVAYVAYDPARGRWIKEERYYEGSTLHLLTPSSLTLDGRTLAWKSDPFGTSAVFDREIGHATFDAERGLWVEGDYAFNGTELQYWITSGIVVRDGLVAWKAESGGILSRFDVEIGFAIYNPVRRAWQRGTRLFDGRENDPWQVSAPQVEGHLATWTAERGGTELHEGRGYDHVTLTWPSAPTVALATFATSSTIGQPPLGVWFSDQSLGASSWAWDFGDGITSAAQHPYHRYTNAGIYRVTLEVSGPGGGDVFTSLLTVSGNPSPLQFVPASLTLTNQTFRAWLTGVPPGGLVVIETSTNLVDWSPWITNHSGDATVEVTDPVPPGQASRFYRAIAP